MEIRSILARNLRRLREVRELSQEALADEAGLNRGHISDLEREIWSASIDTLASLAKALGVKASALIEEDISFD